MRRRAFIAGLGGATAALYARPRVARAQQAGKLPTIGVLGTNAGHWNRYVAAFVQRLNALGWVDGRNVAIEYRWSDALPERYPDIAAEFVQKKVDVIVTFGGAVTALKQATSTIPIVFAIAVDPVGSGFVASLPRPGGNATGLSLQITDSAGKRLELLREIVPRLRRLGIMFDANYSVSVQESSEVEAAARDLGLVVASHGIQRADAIPSILEILKAQCDALYVVENALVLTNRMQITTLALAAGLPTIFNTRDVVQTGGLMSYGADNAAMFQRTADFVDKILRGAKPGDIPVEQPTKFELVINLKTAKTLGLDVPPLLLARADEVIE